MALDSKVNNQNRTSPSCEPDDKDNYSTEDEEEVLFELDEEAMAQLPHNLQGIMRRIHLERLQRLRIEQPNGRFRRQHKTTRPSRRYATAPSRLPPSQPWAFPSSYRGMQTRGFPRLVDMTWCRCAVCRSVRAIDNKCDVRALYGSGLSGMANFSNATLPDYTGASRLDTTAQIGENRRRSEPLLQKLRSSGTHHGYEADEDEKTWRQKENLYSKFCKKRTSTMWSLRNRMSRGFHTMNKIFRR
ncbi:hypothetical protein P168DRAFT_286634 [Aspergillus campestris IBT 28561]|uniref:Uncharacterized protein n=1 Tax=Aspergillus campestris (strain IBT 28561) TaxID=1392248 RepID=A0A2I1DF83_ASPC2|nr:uncharacterized protein P168DRAFT_286634 [Aspergillus campestris IBT 28561]PKY08518.1 hypothetical protein P168DRAFT_286634 [Aspergillus campestris IBT 28561]